MNTQDRPIPQKSNPEEVIAPTPCEGPATKGVRVQCVLGFGLSVVSLFLNFYGIVALVAVGTSFFGLVRLSAKGDVSSRRFALLGIAIGAISLIYAYIQMRLQGA